jgi:hypothetical protein
MSKTSQLLAETEHQLAIHQQLMEELDVVLISNRSAKEKVSIISKKVRFAWGKSLVYAHNQALQIKPSR